MWLSEQDDELLVDMLERLPRAPVGRLRKIGPELAVRTTYYVHQPIRGVKEDRYDIEIWYVDRTDGARWVEAKRTSGAHRRGVGLVKTMLQVARLQGLVGIR